jgi:hypothetical protein
MVQKVQMSTSFIQKSGAALGSNAGDMLLAEYLRSVCLLDPVQCLPSSTARTEVQLCHLDSFAKLLRQTMDKDPMDNVDDKYKEQLPEELKKALLAAKPHLPAVLIQVLAAFAEKCLADTSLRDTESMVVVLANTQDEFEDAGADAFGTVQRHLPAGLQVKHWVAAYRMLKQRSSEPLH